MKIFPTEIPDVLLFQPNVFEDSRGYFFEHYSETVFQAKTGLQVRFVQDNYSRSHQNVLRGLHYQIEQAQGKLVSATVGSIFDVAVDLRQSSPTFGQWVSYELSATNRYQLWIPPGFAHGFGVRSEVAEVLYKTTNYYAPQQERCIIWNDPDLAIAWQLNGAPILSAKDQAGQPFCDAEVFV